MKPFSGGDWIPREMNHIFKKTLKKQVVHDSFDFLTHLTSQLPIIGPFTGVKFHPIYNWWIRAHRYRVFMHRYRGSGVDSIVLSQVPVLRGRNMWGVVYPLLKTSIVLLVFVIAYTILHLPWDFDHHFQKKTVWDVCSKRFTPPKINMEHNNGGLEDDFPFQIGDF